MELQYIKFIKNETSKIDTVVTSYTPEFLNKYFMRDFPVRSLYRSGSLKTAASEMAKCNLHPVAV